MHFKIFFGIKTIEWAHNTSYSARKRDFYIIKLHNDKEQKASKNLN